MHTPDDVGLRRLRLRPGIIAAAVTACQEGEHRIGVGGPPDAGEGEDRRGRKMEPDALLLARVGVEPRRPFLEPRGGDEAAVSGIFKNRPPEARPLVSPHVHDRLAVPPRKAPSHHRQDARIVVLANDIAGVTGLARPVRCHIRLPDLDLPAPIVRCLEIVEKFGPRRLDAVEIADGNGPPIGLFLPQQNRRVHIDIRPRSWKCHGRGDEWRGVGLAPCPPK